MFLHVDVTHGALLTRRSDRLAKKATVRVLFRLVIDRLSVLFFARSQSDRFHLL